VVELQDYWIALAALDARVLSQVLPRTQLVLIPGLVASYSNMRDVFLAIALVPKALVLNEARPTPRVTDTKLGISETELINGLVNATLATGSRLDWLHRTRILSSITFENKPRQAKNRSRMVAYSRRIRVVGTSRITSCVPLTDVLISKMSGTTTERPTG
jgi:hypothetical protein